MKAALSLMLVLALVMSALPVTAQKSRDRPPGPITPAMIRDAVRRAAEPTVAAAGQKAGLSKYADWSRVRKLKPGTEVIVTPNSSRGGKRYVLSADDSGMTVLNLTYPALPTRVASVLRTTASVYPQFLADPRQTVTYVLDDNVRLDRDGVFVSDRKVASLAQIVERIARSQVAELRLTSGGGGSRRHPVLRSVGLGMAIGLGAGLVWGTAHDCRSCDDPGLTTFLGTVFGLGFGAAGGLAAGVATALGDDIVYRAP